jgi:hypothetical protein
VRRQLITDLSVGDEAMWRITRRGLAVIRGAGVYDLAPPFSLPHLSSLCARVIVSLSVPA